MGHCDASGKCDNDISMPAVAQHASWDIAQVYLARFDEAIFTGGGVQFVSLLTNA